MALYSSHWPRRDPAKEDARAHAPKEDDPLTQAYNHEKQARQETAEIRARLDKVEARYQRLRERLVVELMKAQSREYIAHCTVIQAQQQMEMK